MIPPLPATGLPRRSLAYSRERDSRDDLTVREYQTAAARVYPTGMPLSALADNKKLARFIGEASAPKGTLAGDAVYGQVCKTCHDAGLAGAPKIGDKAAWGPRIAQNQPTLTQHAIAGFQGKTGVMPPKGGNADLTDTEVGRAVVYMANQAGANWKEPAAPAASSAPSAGAPAPAVATPAPPAPQAPGAPAPAAAAAKPDGKNIYNTTCVACHGAGIAGAPKFGDKSAWAARIAEGNNTLYTHAIQGFQGKGGVMPPKGGNTTLADADVKAAVDYMVSEAK